MSTPTNPPETAPKARRFVPLRREVGLVGAVLLGLGSILGTGVFVSMGIAAGISGPSVVLAILLAGVVALCNALSSAQLAAKFAVSGGTYLYGYELLTPWLGFLAGWMFLCAKSASAATAALGFAGYVTVLLGEDSSGWLIPIALTLVGLMTALVASGIRRSNLSNGVIVAITLVGLLAFIFVGGAALFRQGAEGLFPFFAVPGDRNPGAAFLHATALMFVAFTGYGRIATLGEEVRDPQQTIPRAILVTLGVSSLLYVFVALVALAAIGPRALAGATAAEVAPLVVAARAFGIPAVSWLVALAAMTAMLGVLLNLLLGLSRVVLAMARQGDFPRPLAHVQQSSGSPGRAVVLCGVVIVALVLVGSVKLTWSFSALTVLVYYAITNLAALRLPEADRRYPRWIAAAGLCGCLGLVPWIELQVWLWGAGVAIVGLLWHGLARWRRAIPRG